MKLREKLNIQRNAEKIILNKKKWSLFQAACVFLVLGSTAAFMTIINFITGQGTLSWVTFGFSVACFLDLLLISFKGVSATVSMVLFAVEISALFTYFIISGNPNGVSVIWMTMLPSFGMLLFELRYGTSLSLLMFFVLVFFFWTPAGQGLLQFNYSKTFMTRFPLLYITCIVVAYLLGRMGEASHKALRESQKDYEHLCYHDALTNLYNRFWLQSIIDDPEKHNLKPSAVAILDIDNFKQINDSYGHPNGDIVICETGDTILQTLNGSGDLCRWGGDEFLVLFHTDIDAETVCRRIVDAIRSHSFTFDGKTLYTTLSIGLVAAATGSTDDIEALIHQADVNLYQAKENGRNCMISSRLGE